MQNPVEVSELNISSITYERLVNLGNYENERLSVTVQPTLEQSPEAIVESLTKWVDDQLKIKKRMVDAEKYLKKLEDQDRYYKERIKELKSQIQLLQTQIKLLVHEHSEASIS